MSERIIKGEVDHCRHRLLKFCKGQGVDIGCGNSLIRVDAIGVDLYNPEADLKMDARLLREFPDNHFDYVFSSHLLEEIENTEATLREWLRILKPNGNIVLYQADKNLYYSFEDPRCNRNHKHHFSKESLWEIFKKIGGTTLTHTKDPQSPEWSFELVVKKDGSNKNEETNEEGISLLIPTYLRPQNMEQFALSVDKTTQDPNKVELIFGLHEEDIESIKKAKDLKNNCKIQIKYELIKHYPDNKINLSFLWNQLYVKANNPILGYFGDDVIFRTPGWDIEIRNEYIFDKALMICTNDVHVQRGKQATLYFTHKVIHEKFGFYLDERFRRWYMDTYWDQIYRQAGKLHYREDIVCEHIHPNKFPEKIDTVYKNMECFKDSDTTLWHTPTVQEDIKNKAQALTQMKYE
jgi:SAM-dependent methyltransferase